MKQIDLTQLDNIEIPKGLEQRLSAKIDEWDELERKGVTPPDSQELADSDTDIRTLPRLQRRPLIATIAAAACIALVMGIGWHYFGHAESVNLAEQDTFTNPEQAYAEAHKALSLLAYNINQGMSKMEKINKISQQTEQTLNEQLSCLGE